ncbi:matrixin family metalloprotease [Segeticoccus rhizosphaerae]|uniref:matrixin family metalloprotease n=1 Tax=Segeticoccus rhizosphaerae TaxID=1104777 RepID=UPI00138FDA34|nr:matrixin family metalloprotease [Ornithinicoccus soli]
MPIGLLLVGTLAVGTKHVPLSVLRVVQQAGDTPPIPTDARRDPLGTPPPAPAGEGGYRFMAHLPGRPDVPVAYDPCRPIHVVVSNASAPAGADRLLREATREVSHATGLVFVIDGPTDELPSKERPEQDRRYGDRWSPVLVAWTTPAQDPRLRGRVAGIGGSTRQKGRTSQPRYVTGIVSLDGPAIRRILARPDGHQQARAIVMHELGHLVGLAHVPDAHQLMYPENNGRVAFGDGDLRGLHELGLGKCYFDT